MQDDYNNPVIHTIPLGEVKTWCRINGQATTAVRQPRKQWYEREPKRWKLLFKILRWARKH